MPDAHMGTIVTVPIVSAPTENFPVLNVANGIVPDEALAITCNLQFSPTAQAILIDLTESARKFNTIPIQGAFVDMSGSTIDMRLENPASGQSILAKASLQGYYNLLSPMPQRFIAVLASAPASNLNITVIFYNTVIESEVWGLTTGPAGPTGAQGPPGATGATGATGPQGPTGPINTVQNQGTALAVQPILNFTGAGVTASNDAANTRTNITIPGYTLPAATATTLGGVMTGSNVSISGGGVISVPPTAAFQTPWLSNINGAGFNLNTPGQINNATSLGLGTASNPNNPLLILSAANAPLVGLTSSNPSAGPITVATNDANVSMSYGVGGSARSPAQEQNNGFLNVYPTGNLIFETNSTEQMRVSPTGFVGIGTPTPIYKLDIRTSGTSYTQIHISSGTTDAGGYLASGADDQMNLTAGATWNGTNWIAKTPVATLITLNAGYFTVTSDSGLTVGSTFSPTVRMIMLPTGLVGIGTSGPGYKLDVRASGSGASQFHISSTDVDSGGYLTSAGPDTLWMFGGMAYNGTNFIAKATDACSIFMINGLTQFANYGPLIVGQVIPSGGAIMTVYASGVGIGGAAGGGSGVSHALELGIDSAAKPTTNTWTISSGAKVKRKVKRLSGGLSVINKLRPTEAEYNGRGGTPEGQRVVSLIAEEVREILPHSVTEDKDGNLGFNVHEVIHHLILAVQQLSRQLETATK